MFNTGTCLKYELYDKIKGLLLGAGWNNVSSNASDFDVMTSTGMSGDKNLVFQMRPTGTSNTNSVITTDYSTFTIRLIAGYVPSATGTAGTVERPTEAWRTITIGATAPTSTIDKNTTVTYRYDVNKNRIIIVVEYPPAINIAPSTFYIGIPDETYCSEPRSRGLLFMASSYGQSGVLITDNAGELASVTTCVNRNIYCQLTPKNPNSAGNYTMSEIFYGDTSEGTRGKLGGVFALPNQNIQHGDIIVQDNQEFLIVVNGTSSTDAFPSKVLALPLNAPVTTP